MNCYCYCYFLPENFPLSDLLTEISTGVETTANSSTSLRYTLCLPEADQHVFKHGETYLLQCASCGYIKKDIRKQEG